LRLTRVCGVFLSLSAFLKSLMIRLKVIVAEEEAEDIEEPASDILFAPLPNKSFFPLLRLF
jgi:hypothetical protein